MRGPGGPPPAPDDAVDAVVLAGGRASRLGGVSKPEVRLAGRTMLDHVLDATAGARRVVVVGPPALARDGVRTVLEDPPLGGPVAGIARGLEALPTKARAEGGGAIPPGLVLVLACDVPRAARAVPRLRAALDAAPDADGARLLDREGSPQPLVALYRRAALDAAVRRRRADGGVHGCSVRRLVAGMALVGVPDEAGDGQDADTWDAVARLDAEMGGAP